MLNSILELNSADVKKMQRKLRAIEPDLLKEFRKEIRAIAKPINTQIKANIPDQPPMSGMGYVIRDSRSGNYYINEGRLNWLGSGSRGLVTKGKVKDRNPRSTTISQAIKANGRSLTTPLVKIILNSAAVSMSDMAGRKSKAGARGVSREYTYRKRNGEIVRKRHRVTTQGRNMIQVLESRFGSASRFGWAALEKQLGQVEKAIDKVLDKYYRIANRGS